jgi:hypothetical protein
VIVRKRGPESDINLLIKQQKNFDKEQKIQGDKGSQGAQRTIKNIWGSLILVQIKRI